MPDQSLAMAEASRSTPIYVPVNPGYQPLRIGIILDDLDVPAWIDETIEAIRRTDFAQITVLIVKNDTGKLVQQGPETFIQALRRAYAVSGKFLYRLYVDQDAKGHPQFLLPVKKKSLHPAVKNTSNIFLQYTKSSGLYELSEEGTAAIRNCGLDVVLHLECDSEKENPINPRNFDSVRYGVWSYYHDNDNSHRLSPSLFWQMVKKKSTCRFILQKQSNGTSPDEILYTSYGSIVSNLWLSQNRAAIYRKAPAITVRALRQIATSAERHLDYRPSPAISGQPVHQVPLNRQMLPFLGRLAKEILKNKFLRKFMVEQWFLAYRKTQDTRSDIPSTEAFTPFYPTCELSYADPFSFRFNGRDYIFFESIDHEARKGQISYIAFDDEGCPQNPKLALSCNYHLSYPFIFEWKGEAYMIPEASASRAVKLYKANAFPNGWTFVSDLLTDVCAVDSTVLEHDGVWYMFTNISESGGSANDELFLFIAQSPLGPWQPHPMNPVKSDVRSARQAGRIFRKNGKLIRPAQDCSVRYGYAIQFCEITRLSETEYEEQVIGKIDASWMPGLTGTHTYNRTETLEVIDGKKWIWKPFALSRFLRLFPILLLFPALTD
nr:hypothetical protein [uncultured Noviherbaspirillum sp.]